MARTFWPLERGHRVTSPFGPRAGGFHAGTDFGREGGSAGMPVYAVRGGKVLYAGAAQGYGGPAPAGWVVIDHPAADGGGTSEYGHIVGEVRVGQRVEAGQRIGHINPNSSTNGGVAPHLHLAIMPYDYRPSAKIDPLSWLGPALYPGEAAAGPARRGMTAAVLAEAMGHALPEARYAALLPAFVAAMRAADITNSRRAAQWCAQIGHESLGLLYMEEIADGSRYEGRQDLGNTQPGDGRRFKGSGPIQLTGRHNFTAFSRWAAAAGHTEDPTLFVRRPELVRELPGYGFLAASWYWTQARPQLNRLADAGDLEGVTRAINGGLNGLADRRTRYHRCIALGDQLLPPDPEEGFMSALSPDEQRELYNAICKPRRSLVEGSEAEFDHATMGQLTDAATFRTEKAVESFRAHVDERLDRIEKNGGTR